MVEHRAPAPMEWRVALVCTLWTLVVLAVVLPWAGFSYLLFALECDDGCSPGQSYWQYHAQGGLALIGILLWVGTAISAWRHSPGAFAVTIFAAILVATSWLAWIAAGNF